MEIFTHFFYLHISFICCQVSTGPGLEMIVFDANYSLLTLRLRLSYNLSIWTSKS